MTKPEKKIEKKYTFDNGQLVEFLEKMKDEINSGTMSLGEEKIEIPNTNFKVEHEFKIEKGKKEIEIEIKWN